MVWATATHIRDLLVDDDPKQFGDDASMTEHFDVVIIGAGAAGVAAARHLQASAPDRSIILLEASGRVGGRAYTVAPKPIDGAGLDLGCGWLHGARTNAWTRIAGEIGLIVDQTPAPWDDAARQLNADSADERAWRRAIAAFFERASQRG